MNNDSGPTATIEPPDGDDNCADLLRRATGARPGMAVVGLDTHRQQVSFVYDRRLVSEPELVQAAKEMAPAVQRQLARCTMRLGPVAGRSCESCALALENQLQRMPGVRRATASFGGGVLSVAYDDAVLNPGDITRRGQQLGVPLSQEPAARPAARANGGPMAYLARLRQRAALEAALTALALLAMLAGLAAETLAAAPAVAWGAYAVAYLAGGFFGARAGLRSLRRLIIDVDLLMILAALGAAAVGALFEGAMLLFLFSLSNVLQSYALGRTRAAIRALMKLRPAEAEVRRDGRPVTLPIEQIAVGETILVRPGERIALDGQVLAGESEVDQSPITGESMPVGRGPGDPVLAGSINQQGALEVRVSRPAGDSTIARLIALVEQAQSEKAPTQRFIDRAEQRYALGVILFTIAAALAPLVLWQEPFQVAFYRAMTLMVAASPCALVISTPATVLSAIANGARRGVLFKGGVYVEQAATIKVVAFDKTGTLTLGRPQVTDVVPLPTAGHPGQATEGELLALAAAVEARSEHPLGQAIVAAARQRGLSLPEATGFQSSTGHGVRAEVAGRAIVVGSLRYLERFSLAGRDEAEAAAARLQEEGKTTVFVAHEDWPDDGPAGTAAILGLIAVADALRPAAPAVVQRLRALGVRTVILTGDNQRVAKAIGRLAGVDAVHAGLLPEDKMRLLKEEERRYGPVAMVGDGVNDAPALASATIGIAMGAAGTDVALETADIVLMSDDLAKIPYLMALSRQTRRTLLVNLAFALAVIVALVAAVLGLNLPLPLSVVGHEGSTVLVSLNGLRLLGFRGVEAA